MTSLDVTNLSSNQEVVLSKDLPIKQMNSLLEQIDLLNAQIKQLISTNNLHKNLIKEFLTVNKELSTVNDALREQSQELTLSTNKQNDLINSQQEQIDSLISRLER